MIHPKTVSGDKPATDPLKAYRIGFYLRGRRVSQAPVLIEADCAENAEAVVEVLLETAHNGIPKNFDDWCLIRC